MSDKLFLFIFGILLTVFGVITVYQGPYWWIPGNILCFAGGHLVGRNIHYIKK